MIKLNGFTLSESKTKVTYDYDVSKSYQEYFRQPLIIDYRESIESVPANIINIPAITNLAVICWFLDIDLILEEIDEVLFHSLLDMQVELKKMYPQVTSRNVICANALISSAVKNEGSMLLYTGGVDALSSYFRIKNKVPILVNVVKKLNREIVEESIKKEMLHNDNYHELDLNKKIYIFSNFSYFYSPKLNELIKEGGWWSHVQHGYALISLLAPLAFIYKINTIYIASSLTPGMDVNWGSTPEVDNKLKWSGTGIIHDGSELSRQDKVDLIANHTKNSESPVRLRVCYSKLNKQVNCSHCEKCLRTILALLLNDANPNNYGFNIDENIYQEIIKHLKKGFGEEYVRYLWMEIYDKIDSGNYKQAILKNEDYDSNQLGLVKQALRDASDKGVKKKSFQGRLKSKIFKTFPRLKKMYMKKRMDYLRSKS